MMLWLAPLVALAQNPADLAQVTSISAIVENPEAYHGKRVRLRGWIHKCEPLGCRLRTYDPSVPTDHRQSLSIGANPEFDLQIPEKPVEIVIHATVDARCLRTNHVCTDRAGDLTWIALERILPTPVTLHRKNER